MIAILIALQAGALPVPGAQSGSPCLMQIAPAQAISPGELMFACWGHGARLGKADSFTSSYNPMTRSTAVIAQKNGETRVLLISPMADDAPLVEDITRDLATVAGRYAGAGLSDLDVDLTHFPSDGTVFVKSSPALAGRQRRSTWSTLDSPKQFDGRPSAARAAAMKSVVTPVAANPGGAQ